MKKDTFERMRQNECEKNRHSNEDVIKHWEEEKQKWFEKESKKLAFLKKHKLKIMAITCIIEIAVIITSFLLDAFGNAQWMLILAAIATLMSLEDESRRTKPTDKGLRVDRYIFYRTASIFFIHILPFFLVIISTYVFNHPVL